MNFILGAALIVAAIALLHAGRILLQRVAVTAPRRENLVADVTAIGFTALFGPGILLFFRELMNGVDLFQVIALIGSIVAVVVGGKLVAAAARRRSAVAVAPVAVQVTTPH